MRAKTFTRLDLAVLCALLTLVPAGTARAQDPGHRQFIIGGAATLGMEADPANKAIGFVSTRATWRFQPDFSFFAEGTFGASGAAPMLCAVQDCPSQELGSRRIRAWHVGMETRLAGYSEQDRHRLMFGAGIGQISLKHFDLDSTITKHSLQASIALELPVRDRVAARIAMVGYFAPMDGAFKAMNGIWEIIGVQAGLTYGF